MSNLRHVLTAALIFVATNAAATFHTFRIHEMYSNADGSVQYIVLHELQQLNGEHLWRGHALTATPRNGRPAVLIFPEDLPYSETSLRYVLVATKAFAALGLVDPDYIMPDGFLPTKGGDLNFADVDDIEFGSLPTDGAQALYRDGTVGPNLATNLLGASASVKPVVVEPATTVAVEYYYADWDYYFMTSFADEIAVLDAGAFGGVWKRTGETFNVWQASTPTSSPACRFFSTTFAPKSSHFYTPFAAECDSVKANVNWQFEAIAFHLQLASANGSCAANLAPLYRLYNNGKGGAPNHRYTTSLGVFLAMTSAGWIFEGDGNTRIFACVPK